MKMRLHTYGNQVSVYGRLNSELDNSPEIGKIPPFQNQLPGATHEQTRTDSRG